MLAVPVLDVSILAVFPVVLAVPVLASLVTLGIEAYNEGERAAGREPERQGTNNRSS